MVIKTIHTQRLLAPTQITLADYVINPYRGCEFGCLYCYSRENKNIRRESLDDSLAVKINAPAVLEKELRFIKPKRVLLGSTTECFQYQEKRFHLTSRILEILNRHAIACTILTKSHLIAEYTSLIGANPHNQIYFTLNLAEDRLIQILEPRAGLLGQRLEAIKTLLSHNLKLRIHLGPYIPYASEIEAITRSLPEAIQEVNVELYHAKQGSLARISKAIEATLGRQTAEKLESVYQSKSAYLEFAQSLRQTLQNLSGKQGRRIYYLVPDFDNYYGSTIDYQTPLR